MAKLLGIVGLLVICAGLDLLWQSRHDLAFWTRAYLRVFRALLRQQEAPLEALEAEESAHKRGTALRVLLGMGFAFVIGPILIAIGLTLILYPRL